MPLESGSAFPPAVKSPRAERRLVGREHRQDRDLAAGELGVAVQL
jgi:hypothetical protein